MDVADIVCGIHEMFENIMTQALPVNFADAFHKFHPKLCEIVFDIYRLNLDAGVKCYSLCQTSFIAAHFADCSN